MTISKLLLEGKLWQTTVSIGLKISLSKMTSATKAESQKIFEKLKTKPANKVNPLKKVRTRAPLKGTGML